MNNKFLKLISKLSIPGLINRLNIIILILTICFNNSSYGEYTEYTKMEHI